MSYDDYGQQFLTEDELINLIHLDSDVDLSKVLMDHPNAFNSANASLFAGFPTITKYIKPTTSIEQFDKDNQATWDMPDKYKELDVITWLVDKCTDQFQMMRVAEELELYSDRSLLPLLQFLIYMVDTFRKYKIVWGVGRGSSVSSYVLFLIGVHKIDSIKYNLDVAEFLR